MPSDLIKSAADRLAREASRTLIERAAERLASPAASPVEQRDPAHPSGRTVPGQAFDAAKPAPYGGAEVTSPRMAEAAAVPAPARRTSSPIAIDLNRLRAAGYITPSSEKTQVSEEFRIVKRPLLLRAFPDGGTPSMNSNLIMVTSSQPGEGKTFVALNLALSLALERNIHVLLIDADFQNPSVHGRLGFEAESGLIDVLANPTMDIAEVMRRTNLDNLSVIAAGTPHRHATELLASARMAQLVDDIAHRYSDRVVIFDSPPLLVASEPSVLALHVGQIVFVVEAETTSRQAVDEALTFISECPSVSIVLNKRKTWLGSKQFGEYYGYGYGSSATVGRSSTDS